MIRQDVPEIKTLLDKINQWKDGPWLRIISPSLIPPESPLIRTLEGHTDTVAAVSVLPEGKRAISGSTDGTLKVWNLEKWGLLLALAEMALFTLSQLLRTARLSSQMKHRVRCIFCGWKRRGITPETQFGNKIACPKCGSDDVTFSKKKQLYMCPDCHHEFIVEEKISS